MSKNNWAEITKEDIIKAIEKFWEESPEYPKAKNTFLIYNEKRLPAKHIRGMAYKGHFGREISKDDYSGGMETVSFFTNLGFDVEYNGDIISGTEKESTASAKTEKEQKKKSCCGI